MSLISAGPSLMISFPGSPCYILAWSAILFVHLVAWNRWPSLIASLDDLCCFQQYSQTQISLHFVLNKVIPLRQELSSASLHWFLIPSLLPQPQGALESQPSALQIWSWEGGAISFHVLPHIEWKLHTMEPELKENGNCWSWAAPPTQSRSSTIQSWGRWKPSLPSPPAASNITGSHCNY